MINFIKNLFKDPYKHGYIEEVDNDLIICILKKDYELNDCLTFGRRYLTDKQNEIALEGQIIKYHKKKEKILFLLSDGSWI